MTHALPVRLLLFIGLLAAAFVAAASAPSRADAADPDHVNFTLEGCRPDAPKTFTGALPFVCDDSEYTTGNLGKFWNELDLVPHRLTADTSTDNTSGYDVTITADYLDGNCAAFIPAAGEYTLAAVPVTQTMIDAGCVPGYDYITEPTLNPDSTGTCDITFSDPMVLIPGAGGTSASIYREVHIEQSAGSHCVFDYDERLALGSHLYPGASLHSNMLNENFGTAGVGARDISIPVKEIEPQELSKTMSATQGESNVWNVSKSSNTSNIDFPNVCDAQGTRSQQVEITVSWTKTTTLAGQTTVTTTITANNPAHRTLTINVTDTIYQGADQSDPNPRVLEQRRRQPAARLAPDRAAARRDLRQLERNGVQRRRDRDLQGPGAREHPDRRRHLRGEPECRRPGCCRRERRGGHHRHRGRERHRTSSSPSTRATRPRWAATAVATRRARSPTSPSRGAPGPSTPAGRSSSPRRFG